MVVAIGGWTALQVTSGEVGGLGGLAMAAAAGLTVYGASLAAAFRAGLWRTARPQTASVAAKA